MTPNAACIIAAISGRGKTNCRQDRRERRANRGEHQNGSPCYV